MVSNRGNGIYRSILVTLGGLAIVASALFLLIRDLSTVDSAYSHSAADAAVEYERDAQAYIKETCFTSTGLREPDCTTKAHEAKREGQRKEQDLAAQNITAWWTKVMGIAALIGMALSAVGVWLVKTTFDETRKSNEISSWIAKQQLRPYVHCTKIICGDGTADIDGKYVDSLSYLTNFENFGQTPAKSVTLSVEWELTDSEGKSVRQKQWPTVFFGDIPPNFACDFDVRILENIEFIKNAIWRGGCSGTFRGAISYNSVEGDKFVSDFNWYSDGSWFHAHPMKRHNNGNTST